MKKVLGAMVVSFIVCAAGNSFAGNPAKKMAGCPDDCQKQIDQLQSSQALQDEQIRDQAGQLDGQSGQIEAQAAMIKALNEKKDVNPWYVQAVMKSAMVGDMDIAGYSGEVKTDTGFGGGIALGRQFGNFRIEGELATQKSDFEDIDSADIRIDTAMMNGSYDIPVGPVFIYGTVGMGIGKVDLSAPQLDGGETTFAYKAGFGVWFGFMEKMAVSLGYEYLGTGDIIVDNVEVEDIKSSNIVAAFRYSF